MARHNEVGAHGEQQAADYLESIGYRILARNWKAPRSRHELDIVAEGEGRLVIVEVKTRSANSLSAPTEAVDWRKVLSVTKAANSFVNMFRIDLPIRFDIISILGNDLEHIKGAFLPPVHYR